MTEERTQGSYVLNSSRFYKMLEITGKSQRSLEDEREQGEEKSSLNAEKGELGEQVIEKSGKKEPRLTKSRINGLLTKNTIVSEDELAKLAKKLNCTKEYLTAGQDIGDFSKNDSGLLKDLAELLDTKSDTATLKKIIKGLEVLEKNRGKYDRVLLEFAKFNQDHMKAMDNCKEDYYECKDVIEGRKEPVDIHVYCYLSEDGAECVIKFEEKMKKHLHFCSDSSFGALWMPNIIKRWAERAKEFGRECDEYVLKNVIEEAIYTSLCSDAAEYVPLKYVDDFIDYLDNGAEIECIICENEPPIPYEFFSMCGKQPYEAEEELIYDREEE